MAYAAWLASPLGRRITQMNADFMVGDGVTWSEPKHELVDDLMKRFWSPAVNRFDLRIPNFALELGLYGEQLWPVFVRPDGICRVGSIDPIFITAVEHNPEDVEDVRTVTCQWERDGNTITKTYDVIRWEIGEDGRETLVGAKQPKPGEPMGVVYTRVNVVTHGVRGTPDLMPVLNLLDQQNQFMLTLIERAHLANMLLWLVKVKGANAVKEHARDLRKTGIRPGTIKVVNEGVVDWELKVPNLAAIDQKVIADLIQREVLIGTGFPPHFFAEGGDVNYATAKAMGAPIWRRLAARQSIFLYSLEMVARIQLQVARQVRLAPVSDADLELHLIADAVNRDDDSKAAELLERVTRTLMLAQEQGWVTEEQAAMVFREFSAGVGAEPGEYMPGGTPADAKPVTEARRLYRNLEVMSRRVRSLPSAPRNPRMPLAA